MDAIIRDYFINPIFDRTGYNAINTLAYAAIALLCLYFIWRALRKVGFDFSGRDFLYGAGAFVLFGSTSRVLTDLSDAGAFSYMVVNGGPLAPLYSWLNNAGIFTYGYLTVTPGIYVITAIFFLLSIAAGRAMKNSRFPAYAGLALWLPCFLLLLPFAGHFSFFALAICIAAAGWLAATLLLEKICKRKLDLHEKLAIGGQALDGAATFVVIDIFGKQSGMQYFEQHVLSSGIGGATPLGFFLFFAVKVALASAIVYFLSKEKMGAHDRALVLIVVGIMGFAPGIRDVLRMLCGT
ncbi:MAG: DUF63 family protein [Candidatus Micrarchaeia archaeon]